MENAQIVMTNLHFHMQTASAPIRVIWYNHSSEQMLLHAHEFTELVFVLRGTALHITYDLEGQLYRREVQRGDVLLIRAGEQHRFIFPEGERLAVCNILYESRILNELFCRDNPDSRALQIINEYPDRPVFMRLGQPLRLDDAALRRVMHTAVRIREEELAERSGSAAFRILALGEILTEIGRLVNETYPVQQSRPKSANFSLRVVLDHIHRNYCRTVTLAELAELAICTPRHLSRRFKQATGETVGEYIRRLRISKACYLLQHTQLRNNRIALDVGYQEYAAFVRAFREQLGMSPTRYRRSLSEEIKNIQFANRYYVR